MYKIIKQPINLFESRIMKTTFLLLFALIFFPVINISAQVNARMLQYPDVSATHITFTYGGDIWIVAKEGGIAHKLTSAKGTELFARFSPDGKEIAFSGNYGGNVDVFVMPSLGGLPSRVTYHGMTDRLVDWYPDGRDLLFASSRESGKQRFNQFYRVSKAGGLPQKLSIPHAEFGVVSPKDENLIAYTPLTRAFRTWKRYLGGMAADIFIFNLVKNTAENISNNIANDEFPMWSGNKIYFLSDRGENKKYNIWSYDLASKQTKQVTNFDEFDIHFPSSGSNEIVFEAGGLLYLLDLTSEKYKQVNVSVVTDESTLMARNEIVDKLINNFSVSYNGNRTLFEARGDIFSVPTENGPIINLTQSPGVAERFPSYSPNGKYAAYFSDRTGEYELTIKDMENLSNEKTLTSLGEGFRYKLYWSPNNKALVFVDQTMTINIYDMDKNKVSKIDKCKWLFEGDLKNFSVSWSSDSRYVAYAKDLDGRTTALAIYDSKEEKVHQVTSGYYSDANPSFDPTGKYLFFLTNRSFKPVYSDFDNSFIYPNSTQVAAVTLSKDIVSPLAPKNDSSVVKKDEEKKNEDKKDEKKNDKKDEPKIKEVKIDFDGFEERIVLLPATAGNYSSLSTITGKVIYHRMPNSGSGNNKKPVIFFDLDKREEKTIVDDADAFQVSADEKKILISNKNNFSIVDIAPDQKLDKKLPVNQMEMTVIPRDEWNQIFTDVWRLERDFFYDKNMHGLDWKAMKKQYGSLIENAVTRNDVNYIIGELIAELNASHTYRGGGDNEMPLVRQVGYLGIDWELKNNAYAVKRIIRGAAWDSEVRSPLLEPGIKVNEGNYILAVNGIDIDIKKDPSASFEGLAGKTIELTVNDKPNKDGSWNIIVKPIDDETRLRNLEWIESNRKRVDDATNGKIGYIYVPSTGIDGQDELVRQFAAQFSKDGLIIDERFNNGGQIPDRFVELLNRKPLSFYAVRDGNDWQWPPAANFGPKVMLINGWSGSGGDAFPDYFRKSGTGPLIGTRTWGGLIGISGAPGLIDGGSVTVPTFRMYDVDGTWFKEGHGVDPDINVVEDYGKLSQGVDVQLEKAIDEVSRLLKVNPPAKPKHQPYEKR